MESGRPLSGAGAAVGPGGRGGLRRVARTAIEDVSELLWPTRCVGCDVPGSLLCDSCRRSLPAIDQRTACPRCGAPFGDLICTECSACREAGDGGGAVLGMSADPGCAEGCAETGAGGGAGDVELGCLDALCCYGIHGWPLDRCIRAYKDAGERRVAGLLAQMLYQAVDRSVSVGPWSGARYDGIVYVPASPEAVARRGFDHMELVACELREMTGIPIHHALACGDRKDQRGLTRGQRSDNAAGSFVATMVARGARYLLIDDVVTTGATMGAAAAALKGGGADLVRGAAVARAWG